MSTSRLILIGAGNLARGCHALTDVARGVADGPVEVHAALGRGRSYGTKSRFLIRELDGIEQSPIWAHLDGAPRPPDTTTALVMDVGNDLFYGVEVPRILAWVESSLRRLEPHAARRQLVGIPLAALRRMRPWLFRIFRTVVVPSCRLSLGDGLVQAQQLHEGLEQLAERHGVDFIAPRDDWYGVDPIHIRRYQWRSAARVLLSAPDSCSLPGRPCDTLLRRLSFLTAKPAERRILKWTQRGVQPARTLADGTTISLW